MQKEKDNWIKTADRLPDIQEEYIVFGKGIVSTLTFNPERKRWRSDVHNMYVEDNKITHWQPLPSPPKQ